MPWNGAGSLQTALYLVAGNPLFDGVEVLANNNDPLPLVIPDDFADHTVVDLDPFEGRVIVVGTNAQGQPYRLARQLEVPAATGAGELRIQGGWLGNVDDVEYSGAVCEIQSSAVVFEGTRFSRHQLQDGDMNQPCTLENQGPLVAVYGTQGVETNSESGTGFIYSLSRTVDFKDCTFQPILNSTTSGCTQVEFPDPLLVASSTRVRLLRPVVDVIDYGYAFEFAQSPIQCTSSMVHIEDATFTALQVQAGEAGFLRVAGAPDMGTTPGLFLRDVEMNGGHGSQAGAVYASGTPFAKLVSCLLNGNSSPTAAYGAGAVHFDDCASVDVSGGSFTGNSGWVGGLLVSDTDTPTTKRGLWVHGTAPSFAAGTQFSSNSGVQAGGILVLGSDNVLVEHATWSGNSAAGQNPFADPRGAAFCSVGSLLLPGSGFTHVGLDSCLITGNTSDVAVSFSESQAWVRDCRFENHAAGRTALRVVGSATGTPLGVQNNRFTNNLGTCVRLEGGVAAQGFVRNNLFEQQGRAVDMGPIGVPVGTDGLRIDGNTVLQTWEYALYFRSRNGDIHVQNNILWSPSAISEISAELPYDQSMPVNHNTLSHGLSSIENIYIDQRIDAATTWASDPQLLATKELKWDHFLMDAGTATGAGEFLAYDFDLTPRDIGWHPVYDVKYLTSNWGATTPAKGWYQVNQNMSFTGSSLTLQPGTVIRVSPNKTLGLATGSANGIVTLGDKNGARTALVGSIVRNGDDALSLVIGPVSSSQPRVTTIEGTLIHEGFTSELVFQNLNLTLDNSVAKVASNVGASLFFKQCKGELVGYDAINASGAYSNPGGIAGIKIFRGSFGVNKCKLDGGSGVLSAPLYIYNNVQSDTLVHQIRNCTLNRMGSGSQIGIYLNQSVIRMTGTTVNDFNTNAIYQYRSSTHLENDAHCQLQKGYYTPLIQASDGHIMLCNGYNNFIMPTADDDPPYVTHTFSITPPPTSRDWSGNFWGTGCQNPGSTPIGRVPTYVAANSTWLTNCVNFNQWVNHQPCQSPGTLLLASGVEKELAGDLAGAQTDYQAALELGTTESATEASLRLKSLGSAGEFGADSYESIRTGLLAAADQVATQDPGLAMLYACNAWVVEAEHGDFHEALGALETLRDAAMTPEDRFNAALALEEAQIVGTPAGLDAAPAERDARREQATKHLFDLLAQGPGAPLPTQTVPRPAGMELGEAYPNPFNPVTTLPITLARDQRVEAIVFNVLGQQVKTLLDGWLAAGTHNLRFDGQGLSSGMYLVQVKAEDGVRTRKVMLLQ